jgi:uncharacterized membrane protein HdeD (DUF308 family)
MELKYYDKPWLPAFKGAFLIIFGLIAMLQIFGTLKTLAVFFVALIGMMAILLIGSGLLYKHTRFNGWTLSSGLLNLAFAINLATHLDSSPKNLLWIMLFWVIFYALSELIEAVLLIAQKNAFFAIYLLNAFLTMLFGYFMLQLNGNFNERSVFFIGIIAFVFGIANELSAYLLSRVKESGR